jgi:predicted nucleotidyltransferase component of viral defense system
MLYNPHMHGQMQKLQGKALKILADKIDDFYLTGGTALSQFYFQHRISEDLGFFTQDYHRPRIREIISCLSEGLDKNPL